MRTTTVILVVAFSAVLQLSPAISGEGDLQENDPSAEQSTLDVGDVPRDWVSAYLADNLSYSESQIQEFKDNVAEMPEEQLRILLRRLAYTVNAEGGSSVANASAHHLNLQRMTAAKSDAQRRGVPKAPSLSYGFQNRQVQSKWYHAPGNTGLFRGYTVWIWGQ
ncbi:MAG: hypothetical protein HYV60_05930 [Planctomycetia bacterium]|nr:hypothetical protein [Planctomycetia bacterium]